MCRLLYENLLGVLLVQSTCLMPFRKHSVALPRRRVRVSGAVRKPPRSSDCTVNLFSAAQRAFGWRCRADDCVCQLRTEGGSQARRHHRIRYSVVQMIVLCSLQYTVASFRIAAAARCQEALRKARSQRRISQLCPKSGNGTFARKRECISRYIKSGTVFIHDTTFFRCGRV